MRWTVNRRIGVGFGIGLALMVLIAAVGVLSLRDATEQHRRAQYEQRMSGYAMDVQSHFQTATLNFLRYLLLPGQAEWVERYDGAYLSAMADARLLRDSSTIAESRRAWGEVHSQLEQWRERTRRAVAIARAGQGAEAIRQWDTEVRTHSVQIERLVVERIQAENARRDLALADAAAAADRNILVLLGGAGLALLVGLLSALQLSRAVTGPLNQTTGTLASSASEILAATTQQASSASETAAAVAQTAATIDEVAQTAEQSAERARAVADTAQRMAEISRTGSAAVEASIESMEQLRDQVESIAASILALADQAQAIGEIIATVDEISGQTNLLALNASIEASRAGEYGRGFAVVASEIRSLADQSKRATVQVRQILGEIQRATGAAVMTTEEGTKQVAAGSKQATRAGQTIRELSQTVTEAAHSAVQIAASSSQQAVGMAQLRQAMTQIQEASHQNLSAVQQTERAATDLNQLGSALLELVSGASTPRRRG